MLDVTNADVPVEIVGDGDRLRFKRAFSSKDTNSSELESTNAMAMPNRYPPVGRDPHYKNSGLETKTKKCRNFHLRVCLGQFWSEA